MRLQSTGSHDHGADEIFMNFASGGQQNEQRNDRSVEQDGADYQDPLDDVFGSAPSSPTAPRSDLNASEDPDLNHDLGVQRSIPQDPSDIPRLRSVHVTNGYREGLSAAKEQYVQAGFDEGYSLGAELGMKVGWLLGVLEAVGRALSSNSAEDAGTVSQIGLSRDEVRAELVQAEEELAMSRLFGEEFFGGDGVWVYPVSGAGGEGKGEEDVTFEEIAAAHPLVVKWEGRVKELVERAGLKIGA